MESKVKELRYAIVQSIPVMLDIFSWDLPLD